MRNSSQNSLITRSLRLHSSRWFVQGLGAGTDQEHGSATTSNWWGTKTLFTKTLIQEDMHARDFTLLGDSNDCSANLRTNTNLQWNCHKRILQTRMHPPNQRLVTIYHESKSKSFKLQKNHDSRWHARFSSCWRFKKLLNKSTKTHARWNWH